jgi:hypothetical protein
MGMEGMSVYSYYCETKYIKILEAKKLMIESFEYTDEHLFHQFDAVVCTGQQAQFQHFHGIGFVLLDVF